MVKTIIFDYDGTIHNTLGIYEPAFREAYQWLSEQNVVEDRDGADRRMAGLKQQRNVGYISAGIRSEI